MADLRRGVFIAEFIDGLANGVGEFAVEDDWSVFAIDVDVVFSEGRVDAVDYVVEVFVDERDRGAEDNEVEVEYRHRGVEVGFGEDEVHEAFAFS